MYTVGLETDTRAGLFSCMERPSFKNQSTFQGPLEVENIIRKDFSISFFLILFYCINLYLVILVFCI